MEVIGQLNSLFISTRRFYRYSVKIKDFLQIPLTYKGDKANCGACFKPLDT